MPDLQRIDGFISVERFESLSQPGKILSLSFWRDEQAVARWREQPNHRGAQAAGRTEVFDDYRLRVAAVVRDYGMTDRARSAGGLADAARLTHPTHAACLAPFANLLAIFASSASSSVSLLSSRRGRFFEQITVAGQDLHRPVEGAINQLLDLQVYR